MKIMPAEKYISWKNEMAMNVIVFPRNMMGRNWSK
jgi:hypothetical protein